MLLRFSLVGCLWVQLAGCTASPPPPPVVITAIDQTDFYNPLNGDTLRLQKHGPYTLRHRLPQVTAGSKTAANNAVESGSWNLLSMNYQVITLDNRRPVRLAYYPGQPHPYQFIPITLISHSTLTAEQQSNYTQLTGVWDVLKADITTSPAEQPLAPLLDPAARYPR